jgi:hypothetical protein
MTARDELRRYVSLLGDWRTPRSQTDDRVERLYQAVRAEVLAEQAATAYEHRIPVAPPVGGYGEIVVRRDTLADDRWCITDGANRDRKVWVDGNWRPAADYSMAAAHPYAFDEAMAEARQVAVYEAAATEAQVRAIDGMREEGER